MKLNAFSLAETIIVIILTGILIFFSVYSYLIIKQHEDVFLAKSTGTAQITLAVAKLTDMNYKATNIKWQDPDIIFEAGHVLGKARIEGDSLSILNAENLLLTKVGSKGFTYQPLPGKGSEILIKSYNIRLDQIKTPLIFESNISAGALLNNNIVWE